MVERAEVSDDEGDGYDYEGAAIAVGFTKLMKQEAAEKQFFANSGADHHWRQSMYVMVDPKLGLPEIKQHHQEREAQEKAKAYRKSRVEK
jgi:hypothetical protein